MPNAFFSGLKPDGSKDGSIGLVAVGQEVGVRLCGNVLAKEGIIEALALDKIFDVPTCGGSGTSIGKVCKIDNCGIIRFNRRSEQHPFSMFPYSSGLPGGGGIVMSTFVTFSRVSSFGVI